MSQFPNNFMRCQLIEDSLQVTLLLLSFKSIHIQAPQYQYKLIRMSPYAAPPKAPCWTIHMPIKMLPLLSQSCSQTLKPTTTHTPKKMMQTWLNIKRGWKLLNSVKCTIFWWESLIRWFDALPIYVASSCENICFRKVDSRIGERFC